MDAFPQELIATAEAAVTAVTTVAVDDVPDGLGGLRARPVLRPDAVIRRRRPRGDKYKKKESKYRGGREGGARRPGI